ncbi:hypothetical protein LOOC260_110260 [Paucilactobacillus hokkaidonensis JCM 18461]|uniref:Uncharacterized protein n=2 Tax=Paucilactobacillus hokkaidonensis TaxID=1193095 RepID=A0A0A1GUB2_9LACO|nr:hypothetical protein [Paucilactobacillus hokkaidonensis]KRO09769.1 hypothetical protein IV59_GL000382 [Paucilactobacillus hokkaidonensis]BAP85565.1 hypothetical protein LOOC260_110260 [Paucilactobacillus hokkaidonensis JCM 18461]
MQNYQGSLKKVSTNLREHFDEFFLENDRPHLLKAVKPLPKMPDFQRSLFLQRSVTDNLLVNIQLDTINPTNQRVNICGQVTRIKNDQFILKTITNVTYLFNKMDVRYIAQA